MPLSDLPQPGRDRDRPAGRQARGHAAPGGRRLADRAPHDHPRSERAAEQKPDILFLTTETPRRSKKVTLHRKGRKGCAKVAMGFVRLASSAYPLRPLR